MPTLDNLGAGNYADYRNDYSYQRVTGILVLPCADGPPVTTRLHQEYGFVIQNFAGGKKGTPPLLPKPKTTETVIAHDVFLPLPIPGQSSAGVGFSYSAVGRIVTLQAAPSTPTTGYDYPQWPMRLEPMVTQAEQQPANTYRLDSRGSEWNQSYTIPPQFFSSDI